MAQYSANNGLTWHSVQNRELDLLVGGEVVTSRLSFTYSVEGPLQIELVAGPAGSFWDMDLYGGLNHLGYWSENLHADVAALQADGSKLLFGGAGEGGQLAGFAYLMLPEGHRVELIDTAMRPMFEAWFSGEPLPG